MLKQSNQFTNAIKSDVRDARARVTINGIVYDDEVINNIEFSGSALSGEQFSIGSTHENTIKVEFSEIIDTLTALDKVYVEIGFKRAKFDESLKKKTNIKMGKSRMGTRLNLWNSREDVEYSLMGEFYITEHVDINYNDKITTISCKDQTVFLEDDYESNLTYPTDIRNVIIEIANQTGVQVDTLNIEELEGIQVGKIEGYSHRQALGFLAQLLVGYVYFNRKGLLQIKQLSESDYDISTEEYFSKGLTKNGIRYRVGGIACNVPSDDEPQDLFVGSKLGPQITIENPLMTQSLLQSIYDKLQDIDYYPFDLDWRGNPALEVGDLVTVYDVEGHELKVPNLNYGLTYNGGLVASSSADTKSRTDIVASGRKTLQQQINTTQQRIKETSDNLMDAFKDAQEKITGNQGGFIIQRMNEDGKPYEFLVMDTEDINSATNVIRLNQQGIGFSRNGYNGPFGVAITIDGQIVADYITAGTLSADLIQSGFNKVAAGTSITQEGIKQVDASGEYAIMQGGGMRFYTALDTLNGSIESSYQGSEGDGGETGVGIFIEPNRKFVLVRHNPVNESNTTIAELPVDTDELRLRRNLNVYGNTVYGADSVRTRNDINESVFRTWSSGESFVGGTNGARLGYYDGSTSHTRFVVPKSGSAKLFTDLEMSGTQIFDASSVNTRSGNHESAFRTWASGEAFIGGPNGARLGYSADGKFYSLITFPKTGAITTTRGLNMGGSPLDMSSGSINDVNTLNLRHNNLIYTSSGADPSTGHRGLTISAGGTLYLMANGHVNMKTYRYSSGTGGTQVFTNIDMQGNTITNQSDIRLKKNVNESTLNALREIERLKFVEYEWDTDKRINSEKPEGSHFGIIAQHTPFLQTKTADSDSYLSVDLVKQINLNSKGIQELYHENIALKERIEALEAI